MLDFRGSGFITGDHIRIFVVRRNFLVERCRQLDVSVSSGKGAERTFHQAVERTGNKTVGLAEHDNLVAALVREWLNPDAVLLVGTGRPRVFFTEFVGPGDALLARTESVGALTAVTADNIGEGVSLRAEDRRVGAILVAELRVDRDAIHRDVAVVDGRARVALGAGQVHVTRDEALAHTLGIGQVCSLRDTTTGDHVGVDDLVLVGGRRFRRQGSWRGLSRLRGHGPVEAARSEARGHAGHQSQSQSS